MITAIAAPATDNGGSPANRDRAFTQQEPGSATTLAVFDGHGPYGGEAATWASAIAAASTDEPFPSLFQRMDTEIRTRLLSRLSEQSIPHNPHEEGIYTAAGHPIRGGTTATILRIATNGSLECAHVGDSDVVYWDAPTDGGTVLMADHTPTSAAEHTRIREICAQTEFSFAEPQKGPGTRPVWVGAPLGVAPAGAPAPPAWQLNPRGGFLYSDARSNWGAYVVAGDASECLAMTRSLGDFNLKRFGITATPSVLKAPPPAPGNTRAIVIGSDGFWDSAAYAEVRDIVYRPDLVGNAAAATAALLEWGRNRARSIFGDRADNLTVAVAYCSRPLPQPHQHQQEISDPLPLGPSPCE